MPRKELLNAKVALDNIIQIGRVHLYKPIQIAEILYYSRHRIVPINIHELDTYRTASRKWRDAISLRLVGGRSTSSARYQDNLFDENAIPLRHLIVLDNENKVQSGIVENYIYHKVAERLQDVVIAFEYLSTTSTSEFSLRLFLEYFEHRPGLKRSIDKAYEIIVHALFSTLVEELKAQVSITLNNPDPDLLADFAQFAKYVLGIDQNNITITQPARIYRAGVANAADRGLDMWANFGPAVQVKHLRLDENLASNMTDEVASDDLVIVCKTAEVKLIQSLLNQIGQPIRGIITQDDLIDWYSLCTTKYKDRIGNRILQHLKNEFLQEFPLLDQMIIFLDERGYKPQQLTGAWEIVI